MVSADATDIDALHQLGADDFGSAVVGVGTSIEASVLITANLVDLGVERIWAKAITPAHGKILERIGAHHVVYRRLTPAAARTTWSQVACWTISSSTTTSPLRRCARRRGTHGFTLAESDIRAKYGVSVVGIKSPARISPTRTPLLVFTRATFLIVSGQVDLIERFAARA